MPLLPGKKNVSYNIRELHQGPQFKKTSANHGKAVANKQAVAIALSEARKHPAREESPQHEAAESKSFEKAEHPKLRVRKLFQKR